MEIAASAKHFERDANNVIEKLDFTNAAHELATSRRAIPLAESAPTDFTDTIGGPAGHPSEDALLGEHLA